MTNSCSDCGVLIGANVIPNFGYPQPSNEAIDEISLAYMAKEGKRGKRPPSAQANKLRNTLKRNVELLMERDYPAKRFKTESARQQQVASDATVSWSSIQRALDAEEGKTLDLLADLAVAFTIKPHELLDPELADRLEEAAEESTEKLRQKSNPA